MDVEFYSFWNKRIDSIFGLGVGYLRAQCSKNGDNWLLLQTLKMEVISDIHLFNPHKPVIATQGIFDGVHLGHFHILSDIVAHAKSIDGISVLLTFEPHPRKFLYPDHSFLQLLTCFDEKVALFQKIGLDYLIVLPFDNHIAKLSASQFVRDVLVDKLKVTKMVVGYDHRFGKNREASFSDLNELGHVYGFEVVEIAAQDVNQAIVSSTKIRNLLHEGEVERANEYLGRPYTLNGKVIHGKKMGHKLGFPTANIEAACSDKLIPANGIYAVKVEWKGNTFKGMLSIGENPTIAGASWSIEVHIFDFNKDIYGESITLAFVKKMREEIKFETLDALIAQLKADEINARNILANEEEANAVD